MPSNVINTLLINGQINVPIKNFKVINFCSTNATGIGILNLYNSRAKKSLKSIAQFPKHPVAKNYVVHPVYKKYFLLITHVFLYLWKQFEI